MLLTTSGTHALELALLALGVGPGQEVICPSFTFVSSANAVLRAGARPVFAEIEETTLGLDAEDVERRLTPRTTAILPVHYAGVAPDMEALSRPGPPARPARDRGRGPGPRRVLARPRARHARRRGLPQLPRDEERHLRGGRGARRLRPRGGAAGRDRPGEGHEPRRVLPRRGGQVHLGGGGQQLRALRPAGRGPRRPARQARRDPGAARARWSRATARASRAGPGRGACGSRPSSRTATPNHHIFYLLYPDERLRDEALRALRARGMAATFHYVPLHSAPHARAIGVDGSTCP